MFKNKLTWEKLLFWAVIPIVRAIGLFGRYLKCRHRAWLLRVCRNWLLHTSACFPEWITVQLYSEYSSTLRQANLRSAAGEMIRSTYFPWYPELLNSLSELEDFLSKVYYQTSCQEAKYTLGHQCFLNY